MATDTPGPVYNPSNAEVKKAEEAAEKEHQAQIKAAEEAKKKADAEAKKLADEAAAKAKKDAEEAKVAADKAEKDAELAAKEAEKDRKECFAKANAILKQYDGMEANIPHSSEYWQFMNRYRSLTNK